VVLVNSLAYPADPGVRGLYASLMRAASTPPDSGDSPRIEASDRVRWALYPDGERLTLFLLNTEEHLEQHVLVNDRLALRLGPGELRRIEDL